MSARKPSIQPRPTKASMLRLQKQQASSEPFTPSTPEEPPQKSVSRTPTSTKKATDSIGATKGVKAFMAQQRARVVKNPSNLSEEPVKRSTQVMTGAQRYGGASDKTPPVITQTRNINIVIKQAKAQGKLNISSRGLTSIPKEVINMYYVDPNSIVVDFTSEDAAWYDAVELTKFIAGDNAITEIDERLGEEFGALTHIDFRDNKLKSAPNSIKLLQNLTSILMPYNSFEKIPQVFFELKQLRELDLSHNQIKKVILGDNSIEQLDLSYNEIASIEIDENSNQDLISLRKLNLGNNQIDKLPSSLTSWTKLQELQVNQNKLKFVFTADKATTYPALIRLDASNNYISSINKNDRIIVSMPRLLELSLLNNKFVEAGLVGLHGAPNIQTLDISSNLLQDIPASVTDLIHLQRLDVRGNELHALPYELGKLTELVAIQCEGNPMRAVSSMSQTQLIESLRSNYKQQTEEVQQVAIGHSLNERDAENKENEEDEVSALNFTQKVNITKRLDLSKQQLSELSTDDMTFIEDIPGYILLNNNNFTSFPMNLNLISNFIVHLHLEHNKITNFNFTLDNVVFTALKTLKLSNNRIKSVECGGKTISFPKLEELVLSNNGLTSLPAMFGKSFPVLKILSLSSNKLDDIVDTSFGSGLEILDLSNNDIGYLPPGLSNLENLKDLVVYGNRFRVPRPAVVDQGTKAILEFLKRRNTSAN